MLIEDIQEVRSQVREYVISSFYVADPAALADSASLVKSGVVDETGMLEMVAFLESNFDLGIEEDEIVPENLGSIARIASFVCRKKTASALLVEEADDRPVDEVGMGDGGHVAEVVELDDLHARQDARQDPRHRV
jgi:acyl carrier protein